MYSLDINFLKDRYASDTAKVAASTRTSTLSLSQNVPMIAGLAAMILLPALTGSFLLLLNLQKTEAQKRIEVLDAELGKLNAQNQNVADIEKQIAATNEETKALV
ncbi:MAG: PilN domain-containing protein, partial [Microcystaceae cyanobacterium]